MATIKSIKEKAKRYDEAVKKLKVLHDDWATTQNRAAKEVEEIFPEFAEPKDERIMKIIRQSLKSYFEGKLSIGTNDVDYAICLSWLKKQGNLMKALQISNARIGELIEKNYYLKEQLEKQGNNMGISEVTKQELEDNLNKALEKETPESCNEFLEKQGEQKTVIKMKTPEESLGIDSDTYNKIVDECIYGEQKPIKEHNACEFCEDRYGCVNPCSMKLIDEEKFTYKVKPKFEIGDLITNGILVGKIDEIHEFGYHAYFGDHYADVPNAEYWHKWTIQDAKAGDVLAVTMYPEGTWIGILKEYNGCTFSSYCFVNTEGTFKLGTYNHGNGKAIHPATKEQRDLLFQKMHEAGYEWNAELKQLKKVEQKPAWSEEDEMHIRELESLVKQVLATAEHENDKDTIHKMSDLSFFLKTLKPQPKQEWSEEDKKMLEKCIDAASGYYSPEDKQSMKDWLYSLKDRYTWRPSKREKEALLWCVVHLGGADKQTLGELLEALNKL